MVERWQIYDRTKLALDTLHSELRSFWEGDEDRCQQKYTKCVEELRSLSLKEWYQVRVCACASVCGYYLGHEIVQGSA